jgi:hypothetical protein
VKRCKGENGFIKNHFAINIDMPFGDIKRLETFVHVVVT